MDIDNMTGTFIELTKGRHPAECPCSDCTGLTQVGTPSLLDTMGSLRSNLPTPGKIMGWLVPARSSLRTMVCREVQIQGDQRFTVGREQTCNLVLEEFMFDSDDDDLQCNKTSRVQFEITSEADRPFITDRSMNGTFLNGEKLSQVLAKRLNHGDIISVLHDDFEMFCYLDEVQMMGRNYPLRIITKYLVGNIVGTGAYAVVRKGFTRNNFTPVALKVVKKNQLPNFYGWMVGDDDAVKSEVNILKQLHHPCITKVLDVVETTFELVIVMEFAEGGELDRQVKNDFIMGRLCETTAKFQFYQICHTIAYLHSKQICHRDLKLANILLMEPDPLSLLKVCDFGVSKVWSATKVLKSFVGTPAFMAPEVLALRNAPHLSYNCKSDCWSLGVVLYVLLSGHQPFSHHLMGTSVQVQIMNGSYQDMTGSAWKNVSSVVKDLVMRLLSVNPEHRPSAPEILQHPWFIEDEATCSQARNKMFGTRDSEVGSVASTGADSGMGSKEGSREVESWREPVVDDRDGDEEVVNIRARLRPRVERVGQSVLSGKIISPRVIKTPGKVVKRRGPPVPGRAVITVLKGDKRDGVGDKKQIVSLIPDKRKRRNSEVSREGRVNPVVETSSGGRLRRRRRRTGA